jgi:PAS domain S-box-containing protein
MLSLLPRYFAGIVIALNSVILLGWILNFDILKHPIPDQFPVEPNTAIGFLLTGISLWLLTDRNTSASRRHVAKACAGVVAFLGMLTVSEHFFTVDLMVNHLFVKEAASAVGSSFLNRMAPNAAFNFTLLGLAFVCVDLFDNKLTYLLTVVVSMVTALALFGYMYGGPVAIPQYTQMALPTAVCFALLSAGTFVARPENTAFSTLTSKGMGGLMARRLLPAAIGLPLILGWLKIVGEQYGLYDTVFGAALLVLIMMVSLSVLVAFTARNLNKIEAERIEAENVLLETQRRTRLIIDRANDAFIAIDSHSMITDWNPEAEATFGWTRGEVLGKTLIDTIIPALYRDAHRKGMQHYLATGQGPVLNKRIELSALHKDGREFPIELAVFPLVVGEKPLFCAFLHDITERSRAKQRLEAVQRELEQSNAELQQFAYVAAHDLREPLRTIRSYLGMIKNKIVTNTDEDTRENVNFILDAAERMQMLISDLLSYARVDTQGKEFAPVDCGVVVENVATHLQAAIKESRGQVTFNQLPTVMADESQLFQVISNLIGNAIKFKGKHPPKVHVEAHQSGDEWIISVRDNGIGFDMTYAERIFQMFQRLHSVAEYKGTGIGLAICKKIIERHGGRIWVESEPNKGSTFHFSIPYREIVTGANIEYGD